MNRGTDFESPPGADDPHGNEAHSETFATDSEVAGKADDPHGNAAHSENYLTSGDEAVTSVFGRTGEILAKANDYAAGQIENFASAARGAVDGNEISPSSVSTDELDITNVGARVGLSANQSIPSGASTKVEFDTEDFDDQSEFDTSTHEFTASESGVYHAGVGLNYESPGDGTTVAARIYVNGSLFFGDLDQAATGTNLTAATDTVMSLSASDTVHFEAFQDSGGSIDVQSGNFTAGYVVKLG
jgi:hypothetical protein